jgi:hypothetical protein
MRERQSFFSTRLGGYLQGYLQRACLENHPRINLLEEIGLSGKSFFWQRLTQSLTAPKLCLTPPEVVETPDQVGAPLQAALKSKWQNRPRLLTES